MEKLGDASKQQQEIGNQAVLQYMENAEHHKFCGHSGIDTKVSYLDFEKIGIFSKGTSYNELDAFKKRNIGGIVWREGFG